MTALKTILLTCAMVASASLFAQKNAAYQQYIDTYKDAAIEQMHEYRIPASITLAQALLESAAGNSYLAKKANNHFGIKVSGNWKGGYVTRDDDRKNERFRKYKRVEDSYEDHSQFLLQPRYSRLFKLDPLDYQGWARGLKACGYATLPTYAQRLITIIETYELHQYDEDRYGRRKNSHRNERKKKNEEPFIPHDVRVVNGIRCVVSRQGDTWDALSKETGVSKRKLRSYNEVDKDYVIEPGMNIFLGKKAKKAEAKYKGVWHKVKRGESMYSICQLYGIRLARLYKMNYKDADYTPIAGDLLKVR